MTEITTGTASYLYMVAAAAAVTGEDIVVLEALLDGKRIKDIREDQGLTPSQVNNSIDRLRQGYHLPQDVRTWKAVREGILGNMTVVRTLVGDVESLGRRASEGLTGFGF